MPIPRSTRIRRIGTAFCLLAGPVLLIAGFATTPPVDRESIATIHDGYRQNPALTELSATLLRYGWTLLLPGLLGALRMIRSRALWVGHLGIALAVFCAFGMVAGISFDFFELTLAQSGLPAAEAVRISEAAGDYTSVGLGYLPQMLGFLIGLPLLAVAFARNGALPWWTVALAVAGALGSMFLPGLLGNVPWTLWNVTLLALGVRVLRTSDSEWAAYAIGADNDTVGQPIGAAVG